MCLVTSASLAYYIKSYFLTVLDKKKLIIHYVGYFPEFLKNVSG